MYVRAMMSGWSASGRGASGRGTCGRDVGVPAANIHRTKLFVDFKLASNAHEINTHVSIHVGLSRRVFGGCWR
jgi:hypothetical protein